VGQGRFQAALLIEPRAGAQTASFVEDIWPTVEEANRQAPGQGRITRSMIVVVSPDKPFERAGKGSIIRKMTAEKLEAEIDALYSSDPSQRQRNGPVLDKKDNFEEVQKYVRESVRMVFPLPEVDNNDNLYVLGLDSLKTMEIIAILKSGLGIEDASWLSSQTLYTNPTFSQLSKVLHRRLNLQGKLHEEEESHMEESRTAEMAAMVQKYTRDLPRRSWTRNDMLEHTKLNIALTGSTGSLGTRLLKAALDDSSITKIYCLNRSADAQSRQEKSFAALGLTHNLQDTSKITFLTVKSGQNQLGLPDSQYNELIHDVDILIHNAWKVDFNHSLESFEPVHIAGVRHLVEWSLHSMRRTYIMFISSISSVGNPSECHADKDSVPEILDTTYNAAQRMGYGESKNVAEHILATAHAHSGVPLGILRVGQIAGPVDGNGAWNEDEWLPSLLQTSKSLRCLPDYVPDVDWIPVDTLAATILELAHAAIADPTGKAHVCNLINPTPVPWDTLTGTIQQYLGPQTQLVPLAEWLKILGGLDPYDAKAVAANSAIKILEFYRGFEAQRVAGCLRFDTQNGVKASKTMARLKPVGSGWMEAWLRALNYQTPGGG